LHLVGSFYEIHLNIIIWLTPRSSRWFLPSDYFIKPWMRLSSPPYETQVRPSHSWFT